MKRGTEMMRQKEIRKWDARRTTDRQGRYCLEQDHPGVSRRTGLACGKHLESVHVPSAPQTSAV